MLQRKKKKEKKIGESQIGTSPPDAPHQQASDFPQFSLLSPELQLIVFEFVFLGLDEHQRAYYHLYASTVETPPTHSKDLALIVPQQKPSVKYDR